MAHLVHALVIVFYGAMSLALLYFAGMEAEVAELAAELLEVREGARLEAMAFEI